MHLSTQSPPSLHFSNKNLWLAMAVTVFLAVIVASFGKMDIIHSSALPRISFPARENNLTTYRFSPGLSWFSRPLYSDYWRSIKTTGGIDLIPDRINLADSPPPAEKAGHRALFPAPSRSHYHRVSATIEHRALSSGRLRIKGKGCTAGIWLNGRELTEPRRAKKQRICKWSGYDIDLLPYLKRGENKLVIYRTGRNDTQLVPLFSPLMLAFQALCAGVAALSAWLLFRRRLSPAQRQWLERHGAIGSITLPIVLTLFVFQAIIDGRWTWLPAFDYLATHLPQLTVQFLPVPFLFMLWLRIVEKGNPMALRFSPVACGISVVSLTLAQEFTQSPSSMQFLFGLAVASGLFVQLPLRECLARARRHKMASFVLLVGATAPGNFYYFTATIWHEVCGLTTFFVYHVLHWFNDQVTWENGAWANSTLLVKSPHFWLNVYPGCSGLEGMFLFNFMLSVYFLYDWERFKNRRLLLLYALGLIYMFVVNVLRICAFFGIGYWAHHPASSEFAHSLQGATIMLFHTYIGWVFYLLAFVLYSLVLL